MTGDLILWFGELLFPKMRLQGTFKTIKSAFAGFAGW